MKWTKTTDPIIALLRAYLFAVVLAVSSAAQTTAFTYQGRFTDAGNPANGNYEVQAKLFDALNGGTQQSFTYTDHQEVTNGNFTVTLDFGATAFTGAARFLEIGLRPLGSSDPFTILAPRQRITSSPYAIQSVNTQQLGGLPANRYVAADPSGNVGIGISSPAEKLTVQTPTNNYGLIHTDETVSFGSFVGGTSAPATAGGWFGTKSNHPLYFFTNNTGSAVVIVAIGYNAGSSAYKFGVNGSTHINGGIVIRTLFNNSGVPTTSLCYQNVLGDLYLSNCSSSLRYKKDFQSFGDGLSLIKQPRPLSFKWKANDTPDIGFGAEDVAKINSLFVTHNQKAKSKG
jgi:hypothetical protein